MFVSNAFFNENMIIIYNKKIFISHLGEKYTKIELNNGF